MARRELVFGMHVHVAVPEPDLAMHVMESLLAELPVLLALSASSPFWRGEATGLASTRTAIFASMPRSGQPPRFTSYDDYLEMVGTMEEAGVIDDYTYLWWDVRPHPRLGTVEIRVMDVQFDIDQTLMLAAYVQASVARAVDEAQRGVLPPAHHRQLVVREQVGRRALRAGRAADGPGRRPAHAAAGRRAGAPQRRAARAVRARARLRRCAARDRAHDLVGQRATRMMRAYNANRDMTELMRELAHATELRSGERSARPRCSERASPAVARRAAVPSRIASSSERAPRQSPTGVHAIPRSPQRVHERVGRLAAEREHERAPSAGQRLGARASRASAARRRRGARRARGGAGS